MLRFKLQLHPPACNKHHAVSGNPLIRPCDTPPDHKARGLEYYDIL